MNRNLVNLYHRVPGPVRSFAASLWGIHLRRSRYGRDTQKLIAEATAREFWTEQQWTFWRQDRLARLLHRAATQVPFYEEHWRARRAKGDKASWESIENWPVLQKDELRQNARAFVARDCRPERMVHLHTSGTTGKPVNLWRTLETNHAWYALWEARRNWYGVTRFTRWANIGGQLVVPVGATKPPFWVWNLGLQQLYLSSYHLAPAFMPHYIRALRQYSIEYVFGYSSSLYALASQILRQGERLRMKVAITNAEPLFDYQRRVIEQAFDCPVRETYGMSEIAAAASECPSGVLHGWPDAGYIEVLNDGVPAKSSETGDLVATGLLNPDMPLIRYATGDRARRSAAKANCSCGRTLPVMDAIEGRKDEVLFTADGRQIGRLDPVFKADLPLHEAQIIQESLTKLVVKYVPAAGFSSAAANDIVANIRQRMGQVDVVLEEVSEIPRGANGKFRAVICKLSPEEKRSVLVN